MDQALNKKIFILPVFFALFAATFYLVLVENSFAAFTTSEVAGARARETLVAMSPKGEPLMAYSDTSGDLYYARLEGEEWVVKKIAGGAAPFFGFAVDKNDIPHAAYLDNAGNGAVMYATQRNGEWVSERVEGDRDAGILAAGTIDLALKSDGTPVIVYQLSKEDGLIYSVKIASRGADGGWVISRVEEVDRRKDINARVGDYIAVAVSPVDDSVHTVYTYREFLGVKYASLKNGAWLPVIVDPGELAGSDLDIAFRMSGIPSVAYTTADEGVLKFATPDKTGWSVEAVRKEPSTGARLAFLGDTPHISFADSGSSDVLLAATDSGKWFFDTIEPAANTSRTSVSIDPLKNVFVSFADLFSVKLAKLLAAGEIPGAPPGEEAEEAPSEPEVILPIAPAAPNDLAVFFSAQNIQFALNALSASKAGTVNFKNIGQLVGLFGIKSENKLCFALKGYSPEGEITLEPSGEALFVSIIDTVACVSLKDVAGKVFSTLRAVFPSLKKPPASAPAPKVVAPAQLFQGSTGVPAELQTCTQGAEKYCKNGRLTLCANERDLGNFACSPDLVFHYCSGDTVMELANATGPGFRTRGGAWFCQNTNEFHCQPVSDEAAQVITFQDPENCPSTAPASSGSKSPNVLGLILKLFS